MVKSIGERSIFTQELVDFLSKAVDGAVVTYADMTKLIGFDVRPNYNGYPYLYSAKEILQRDYDIVFETIPKEGIKRLPHEKVALSGPALFVKRTKSHVKRHANRINTVTDYYESLSPEAKLGANMARTLIFFTAESIKPKKMDLIKDACKKSGSNYIGFGDTLALFSVATRRDKT